MSIQPLVSIGVPVYNGGDKIGRALDSLLAQDYPALEILISDNASTDHTLEICQNYAAQDNRIRIHQNPQNIGPALNFEKVLELASGTYFLWAADDDRWSPNYVSALVDAFQKCPGAILSAGRMVGADPHGYTPTGRNRLWYSSRSPEIGQCGRVEVTRIFLHDAAFSWVYGLFQRTLLETEFPRFKKLPTAGADVIFLVHLTLHYAVTGSDSAIFYKEIEPSPYRPKTARQFWRWRFWYVGSLVWELITGPVPLLGKCRLLPAFLTFLRRRVWRGVRGELSILKRLVIPS